MNEKFCSSCMKYKPVTEGKMITGGNKIRRWKCNWCIERRSTAIYAKEKK